ncbi:hypothetical protein D1AOALGA4SA_1877 [Olavius algarvensis Delta 1 endosymbiont]|nr:hypothetical protein D1AOALGA4SA_1877 [Olavius algarvensis Delta 1 endosymbiont]
MGFLTRTKNIRKANDKKYLYHIKGIEARWKSGGSHRSDGHWQKLDCRRAKARRRIRHSAFGIRLSAQDA